MIPLLSVTVSVRHKGLIIPDREAGIEVLQQMKQGSGSHIFPIVPDRYVRNPATLLYQAGQIVKLEQEKLPMSAVPNGEIWHDFETQGWYTAGLKHPWHKNVVFSLTASDAIPGSVLLNMFQTINSKEVRGGSLVDHLERSFDLATTMDAAVVSFKAQALDSEVESLDVGAVLDQLPKLEGFAARLRDDINVELITLDENGVVIAEHQDDNMLLGLFFGRFVREVHGSAVFFVPPPTRGEVDEVISNAPAGEHVAMLEAMPGFKPEPRNFGFDFELYKGDGAVMIHDQAEIAMLNQAAQKIAEAFQQWVE